MRHLMVLALAAVFAVGAPAHGSHVIGLDFVVVQNGAPVFGDHFDDGVFGFPPWFVAAGAPGPESGTTLEMRGGDIILAKLALFDPDLDTIVTASVELAAFSTDAAVSLLLLDGDDLLALTLSPTGAIVTESQAGVLGGGPLLPSSPALLKITLGADATASATVNGVTVYSGDLEFGPITAVGIGVIPEPATLLLLGGGLAACGAFRRRRQGC